jgi:hypothetical protein
MKSAPLFPNARKDSVWGSVGTAAMMAPFANARAGILITAATESALADRVRLNVADETRRNQYCALILGIKVCNG